MDTEDRVELVDRMKCLVNELYRLETCFPVRKYQSPSSQLPCFMMKCKLPKCRSNPDLEPLITWTPVMETRKTTDPKICKKPPDNPTVKYVYVEPPNPFVCPSTDSCLGHCPILRENNASKPPAHQCGAVELCCPTFGPPVDSCGRPYVCQVSLDGRTICKPDNISGSAPPIGCDRSQPQSRFPKCDQKRIMTRGKVLNTRKNLTETLAKRPPSSQSKRLVYPPRNNCLNNQCICSCAKN